MWVRLTVYIPAALLAMVGCEKPSGSVPQRARTTAAPTTTMPDANNALFVAVFADGRVQLDGRPASFAQLDPRFAEAHKSNASVWYYRENASGEPHENAMKVMDLVAKHALPITFTTSPDFSTYADVNTGASYPRSKTR
jgi:biopolymer transport protein ExbD